mmetsp:Transcript_6641/g.10456  ORF Transcript_6641/g.10456 Transcript_6641/m.10456 type:complete len:236 (+) Transcript_6641:354-1061(+)
MKRGVLGLLEGPLGFVYHMVADNDATTKAVPGGRNGAADLALVTASDMAAGEDVMPRVAGRLREAAQSIALPMEGVDAVRYRAAPRLLLGRPLVASDTVGEGDVGFPSVVPRLPKGLQISARPMVVGVVAHTRAALRVLRGLHVFVFLTVAAVAASMRDAIRVHKGVQNYARLMVVGADVKFKTVQSRHRGRPSFVKSTAGGSAVSPLTAIVLQEAKVTIASDMVVGNVASTATA